MSKSTERFYGEHSIYDLCTYPSESFPRIPETEEDRYNHVFQDAERVYREFIKQGGLNCSPLDTYRMARPFSPNSFPNNTLVSYCQTSVWDERKYMVLEDPLRGGFSIRRKDLRRWEGSDRTTKSLNWIFGIVRIRPVINDKMIVFFQPGELVGIRVGPIRMDNYWEHIRSSSPMVSTCWMVSNLFRSIDQVDVLRVGE